MFPDSLYEFSQQCCIVETLCLGMILLFVGNSKVTHSRWLKMVKWMFAAVLLLVGTVTLLHWAFLRSQSNPLIDTALSTTLIYVASFLMSMAFMSISSPKYVTILRLVASSMSLLCFTALIWIVNLLYPTLSQVALFISIAFYLIELSRVVITFFYHYKTLRAQQRDPNGEEEMRFNCMNTVMNIFITLVVAAVLYVVFVLLTQQFRGIYNMVMLLVWGYLSVSIINMIMSIKPLKNNDLEDTTTTETAEQETSFSPNQLAQRVNQWVQDGGYRTPGITLTQVADELSTNLYYLSQYINTQYGSNFKTLITDLRIELAKQLLATTSITIDMVASRTGFSNKSQLTAAFKEREGCTPGVWRQKNLK